MRKWYLVYYAQSLASDHRIQKLLQGTCKTHYNDVMMSAMASQITGVCSGEDQTSKLHVTVLCEGNSPVTGVFPSQRTSNTENVSIWWRHHVWCRFRGSESWVSSPSTAVSALFLQIVLRSRGSDDDVSWWRHQIETFSALLALCAGNSPVTGKFPSQRPLTQSFDVFCDLHLNNQLRKQTRRRWVKTP